MHWLPVLVAAWWVLSRTAFTPEPGTTYSPVPSPFRVFGQIADDGLAAYFPPYAGSAASGSDTLTDTTFIQRINTRGGVAPATGCSGPADIGNKAFVPYQADYVFYRAPRSVHRTPWPTMPAPCSTAIRRTTTARRFVTSSKRSSRSRAASSCGASWPPAIPSSTIPA